MGRTRLTRERQVNKKEEARRISDNAANQSSARNRNTAIAPRAFITSTRHADSGHLAPLNPSLGPLRHRRRPDSSLSSFFESLLADIIHATRTTAARKHGRHGAPLPVDGHPCSHWWTQRLRHAHAHRARGAHGPLDHPEFRARVVHAAAAAAARRSRRPGRRRGAADAAPAAGPAPAVQAVARHAAGAAAGQRGRGGGRREGHHAAAAKARQLHGPVPLQDLQHGPQAKPKAPAPGLAVTPCTPCCTPPQPPPTLQRKALAFQLVRDKHDDGRGWEQSMRRQFIELDMPRKKIIMKAYARRMLIGKRLHGTPRRKELKRNSCELSGASRAPPRPEAN